jgi:hypothetical protein
MRRLQLGVLASVVPALLASLVLVGCGGKEEKGSGDAGKPADVGKRGSSGGPMKAIEPGTGTRKGQVVLDGPPPDTKKLTAGLLEEINKKTDDKNYCLSAPEDQRTAQEWRIGENKGVGNVFVWLVPASRDEYFKIDEKQLGAVAKEVTMDQPFCAFVPHCVVLFPKYRDPKNPKKLIATGQKFIVKNDAKISHNTKLAGGAEIGERNETLAPGKQFDAKVEEPTNEAIAIRCNIHPWMSAYARSFDHPYATVSYVSADPKDAKYGAYEIKGVPAGKVRVVAWHEKAEFLNGSRGEEIELKAGENTKDFKVSAK